MADAKQEDFSQLPFADQFTHKNWKVRKEGYKAAAGIFETTRDDSDPVFKPFLQDPGLWKAAAADANVAAQQEGLTSLCAFLKYGGFPAASRTRGLTIEPIREKGLSSTRPATKAAALEALLLYVEIDRPEPVVEELLPALSHKQPKVIATTLSAITAIFHNFGSNVVKPVPVLKLLPKVFGHADEQVRAEATNLVVELYRWLKEVTKAPFWNDLKPVQQQDLEKRFEKVNEEPPPEQRRLTRAQQAAAAVASDSEAQDGGPEDFDEVEAEQPVQGEMLELAEPVDVFPKIAKDLNEKLASSKWGERKEALDDLLSVFNTDRIKDAHFDDIIRDLAKIISKDANVTVVAVAANCVEKLALGLRKGFLKYRSTIMSPMLERLKEKKQAVTDALGAALDAVFTSTALSDCLEEILSFLTHKNPQVKHETFKFLNRWLRNTREVPAKAGIKLIADAATKLLTESTEVMRSGGAEILGTLMKIMGEREMAPFLDGLDDIRKAKIREYFDAADVKAKYRPKPVPLVAKAADQSTAAKKAGPAAKKKVKKPAAINTASAQEEEIASLKPQPTARTLAKPNIARPGSALSAPAGSKLNALKKPTSGAASPQRRIVSPPVNEEDVKTPAPSPAKFGLGRGGLAGRSLSKPTRTNSYMEPAPSPAPPTGLAAIERAELEELRAEKERLSALADSLRSTNAKLSADISELQNQNAQLIEDHTRDGLQVKAKEAQLVRVRGECDVLRSEVESARRDIERQKREMSRLGRESFGREQRDTMAPAQDESNTIYSDSISSSAVNGGARPGSVLSRTSSSRPPSYLERYDLHSPSEEKENTGDANTVAVLNGRGKISPPGYGTGHNGAISPQRTAVATAPNARSSFKAAVGLQADADGTVSMSREKSTNGPAENWRRAAEVTSQLKARIEKMKARQAGGYRP